MAKSGSSKGGKNGKGKTSAAKRNLTARSNASFDRGELPF